MQRAIKGGVKTITIYAQWMIISDDELTIAAFFSRDKYRAFGITALHTRFIVDGKITLNEIQIRITAIMQPAGPTGIDK